MSRLPLGAFAALAVATVAAFFVTQHLKVSTPLIAGTPKPTPSVISPASIGCGGAHRVAQFSFYLLHRADDVAVYVLDSSGNIVRTLATGRHMRRGVRNPDGDFPWNGRTEDGRVAPDGTYYFRIALLHQGRTIDLTKTPVQVKSTPPHPIVSGVSPSLIPAPGHGVTIRYRGNEQRGVTVRLYRTDLPGAPRAVKSYLAPAGGARWDGRIAQRPAPAGVYLVGLQSTDGACNTGRFPTALPPRPGSTAHAGITVRYLAVQPPLYPVPAGSAATVLVDSRQQPYRWTLRRAGARADAGRGSGSDFALHVALPRPGPGAYVLSLHSGSHSTSVPLLASSAAGSGHGAPILVVLPALTWQGLDPVDDDGDGIPNTLASGEPIATNRVLAGGLPSGFDQEEALLAHLDSAHLPYELTSDLALAAGVGPPLSGHRGVVLAGSERWLPLALSSSLRAFVQSGGHLLSLGLDSLRRRVTLRGAEASGATAPAAADIFGLRPGALTRTHDLITVSDDRLGIFAATSGALPGFGVLQPFTAGPGTSLASAAGAGSGGAAVAGIRLGNGLVVEVGLPGFGLALAHDVDAQELVGRLWQVLGR